MLSTAGAILLTVLLALARPVFAQDSAPDNRVGVASDWSDRHILFPQSKDYAVMSRLQNDPRWLHNWLLNYQQTSGRQLHHGPITEVRGDHRDWSSTLGTATFEPIIDYRFTITPEVGYGSLNTTDEGAGEFLATVGSLTVTAGSDQGTYPLYPGGPSLSTSPAGAFNYDNLLFTTTNPPLDVDALLFRSAAALEINIWGNSTNNYSYYDHTAAGYGTQLTEAGTFTLNFDPGGGQTFPAKYVFNINTAPSCANDYVVIGVAAIPASAGQANIVGMSNLYSTQGASVPAPLCGTTGPTVKFAYASGTGEVPASVVISQNGTKLAYIENLNTGSSYFHVLTLGTTGTNGTSPTAAVVPGTGNNAVDQKVLLSPNGGTTNQSSTTSPFVAYTTNDATDVAYMTTYSWTGSGSGYLYKIKNVFSGTPTIVWSVAINAVPSSPVYDWLSNKVFFTDSAGRIDYVLDSGATPPVVYGSVVASGTTSENPVTIDSPGQLVYACFNTNGSNAIVVQTSTSLSGTTTVPIGSSGVIYYTGPYGITFNNAWFIGQGVPILYVVGTGTGTVPTLYAIGFAPYGILNPSSVTSAGLTTGAADASAPTEFYNSTLAKDYLFVGVTNDCIATTGGGSAGCVMALDITSGFPTISASSTALAAAGGTTGIIVDNNSSQTQASSIYYATKTGTSLVKATQSGLK